MGNSLNNRVYTKFEKHVNNANEVVDAANINIVQDAVSGTEVNVANLHDSQFMDKVLFTFENNLFVNSLFANETNDKTYIDFLSSKNIAYDEEARTIGVVSSSISGETYTTKATSAYGEGITLNDFCLVTDESIPVGASINYYIINEKGESFPITQNSTLKPVNVMSGMLNVSVKAVMTKNAMGESPMLYGLCLMFFDIAVEAKYGLANPDLSRFSHATDGMTELIRDRAEEGRLVQVIETDGVTTLNYNVDGTLLNVSKKLLEYDDPSVDTLNYGPYLDSENVTETVLLSILSTNITQSGGEGDFNQNPSGDNDMLIAIANKANQKDLDNLKTYILGLIGTLSDKLGLKDDTTDVDAKLKLKDDITDVDSKIDSVGGGSGGGNHALTHLTDGRDPIPVATQEADGLFDHNDKVSLDHVIQQYNDLNNKYNTLSNDYSTLLGDYNTLSNEYNTLSNEYNTLNNAVTNLTNSSGSSDLGDLTSKYNTLLQEYDDLTTKYNNLQTQFNNYIGNASGGTGSGDTNGYTFTDIPATDEKADIIGMINEVFTDVNDGKEEIAVAITAKNVPASSTDTFRMLATKIGQIASGGFKNGTVAGNGSNYMTVDGLGFTPTYVFAHTQTSSGSYWFFATWWNGVASGGPNMPGIGSVGDGFFTISTYGGTMDWIALA